MLKLEDVQNTVCDIAKTVDALKMSATPEAVGNYVFADDGTQREAIEDALKSIGWAVVVSPPVGASVKDQVATTASSAGGTGYFNVLLNVAIRTNPKKNRGQNAVVVLVAVKQLIQAALNWKPAPSEKGFSLNHELPFSPDFADEGCFTYDLKLMKTISLL